MRYSVQQIKYEFLYAIKEFDSEGKNWSVLLTDVEPSLALRRGGLDPDDFVFVGKPAGTPRTAEIVRDYFVDRFEVTVAEDSSVEGQAGGWVVLYRAKASLPHVADMLDQT